LYPNCPPGLEGCKLPCGLLGWDCGLDILGCCTLGIVFSYDCILGVGCRGALIDGWGRNALPLETSAIPGLAETEGAEILVWAGGLVTRCAAGGLAAWPPPPRPPLDHTVPTKGAISKTDAAITTLPLFVISVVHILHLLCFYAVL